MVKILIIREDEWDKLQHYADPEYCSGGFQGLCRKLVARVVPPPATPEDIEKRRKDVERDERGLFG